MRLREFEGLVPTEFQKMFEVDPGKARSVAVRKWLVRLVLISRHDRTEPVVEFYSCDTDQFVSSYFADTIEDHEGGLCLDSGVPSWSIDWDTMEKIRQWVVDCMREME